MFKKKIDTRNSKLLRAPGRTAVDQSVSHWPKEKEELSAGRGGIKEVEGLIINASFFFF